MYQLSVSLDETVQSVAVLVGAVEENCSLVRSVRIVRDEHSKAADIALRLSAASQRELEKLVWLIQQLPGVMSAEWTPDVVELQASPLRPFE